MFRRAAQEELLDGSFYQKLRTVAGLRAGKSSARETEPVKPVPPEHIDAALAWMPPAVQAMVRFQLLTGCRPAEVCLVRSLGPDRRNPDCRVYRPGRDRGSHPTCPGRDRGPCQR
jgi:hypothetical protein